jgi:hypothetical protein
MQPFTIDGIVQDMEQRHVPRDFGVYALAGFRADGVEMELGDIPIERMLSVMFEGAEPNEVEADLLARLEDAKFMKEEQ